MEVNKILELKKVYLNYYILCGEDKVIENKPFICVNAVDEKRSLSCCLLNEKKVLEDLYNFFKPLDKSLIITESPKDFIEFFEDRYKLLFEKDCDLDLRKHIYYDMKLGVNLSQALLFFGSVSEFDDSSLVDLVFDNKLSELKEYTKIRFIIMNKVFSKLLKHYQTETIFFKSNIFKFSQEYKLDKKLFENRFIEIETTQKLLPTNKIIVGENEK